MPGAIRRMPYEPDAGGKVGLDEIGSGYAARPIRHK
jgi:hypothetical protein